MNVKILVAGTSVLSAAAGTVAGYILAKKKLEQQYLDKVAAETEAIIENANAETERVIQQYRVLKKEEFNNPEAVINQRRREAGTSMAEGLKTDAPPDLLEQGRKVMNDDQLQRIVSGLRNSYGGHSFDTDVPRPSPAPVPVSTVPAKKVSNIFSDDRPNPHSKDNYAAAHADELDSDVAYIIPEVNFMEQPEEFNQYNFTFWAADGVLSDDETEQALSDDGISSTVGSLENLKFGYLSNDEQVVYIRNDRRRTDWAVTLDERAYAEVVAGIGA